MISAIALLWRAVLICSGMMGLFVASSPHREAENAECNDLTSEGCEKTGGETFDCPDGFYHCEGHDADCVPDDYVCPAREERFFGDMFSPSGLGDMVSSFSPSGLGGMGSSFSPSGLGGFHSQQRPNNNFHPHQSNSQSQHRNFKPQQRCKDPNLAGLIVIHGLVMSFGNDEVCKLLFGPMFGFSEQTIIRCPEAERRHIGVMAGLPFPAITRSWFNHFMLPAMSVKSRKLPGENKKELEEALRKIEVVIEQLMNQCVPSENIVIMGFSQGSVLAWYVAMHTQYKLGGFVPIVSWAPLLLVEPPANINPPPVNLNTPILQMNGGADAVVDPSAGAATKNVMSKVFPNYKYMLIPGTGHGTTAPNPRTAPIIVKWLKENTNLKFGGGGLGGLTGGLGGLTGGLGGLFG